MWDTFYSALPQIEKSLAPEWYDIMRVPVPVAEEKKEPAQIRSSTLGTKQSWDSTPGKCGEWVQSVTEVMTDLGVDKKNWFTTLHQRITGSGHDDFRTIRSEDPHGTIDGWLAKLIKLHDVNVQISYLTELKHLRQTGSFSDFRTKMKKLLVLLEPHGFILTDSVQVEWAAAGGMKPNIWKEVIKHKPTSLNHIQSLVLTLGLETPERSGHANSVAKFTSANPGGKTRGDCHKYLNGSCDYGVKCKFRHPPDCRNFKAGKCKSSSCKYRHPPAAGRTKRFGGQKGRGPCYFCEGAHMKRDCPEFKEYIAKQKGTLSFLSGGEHELLATVRSETTTDHDSKWYIDSGASHTVSPCLREFGELSELRSSQLFRVADGTEKFSQGYGDVTKEVQAPDGGAKEFKFAAYYVPGLRKNLLSVSQLDVLRLLRQL